MRHFEVYCRISPLISLLLLEDLILNPKTMGKKRIPSALTEAVLSIRLIPELAHVARATNLSVLEARSLIARSYELLIEES